MNCVSESLGEIPGCVEGWRRRKADTPACPDNSMVTVIQGMKPGEDGKNQT